MVKTEKCKPCRVMKKGCLPKDRTWDANNAKLQKKCDNCIRGDRQCGPSEKPPVLPRRRRVPHAPEVHENDNIKQLEEAGRMGENVENPPGPARPLGRLKSEDSKKLRDKLKCLEAVVELARQVDIAIEALGSHALLNNIPNTGPNPQELAKLRSAISQSLLDQLAVVDFLADQARDICEIDLAEVAYTRMLHIYQGHPFPDSSRICALLDKMASFYSDLGDPVRVHSCCRDIIKLRDSPDQIHGIERRAWDRLAEFLPHELEIVSNVFRSQVMDNLPSMDVGTPFQISEGMLNSVYNSGQAGVPFQVVPSVDRTGSYNMGNAIESAADLVETIQRLPNLELEARDQCKRTPLFLAAFLKQEDAGHSLLRRIASCSKEMSLTHLNVKDVLGQTVLGAAVSSGCSIIFIRALVERGADVNPDLEARSYTPFQAACMTGNVEVASLLLDREADINRNYPDSPHPIELARTKGHTQILQLIHTKAKPSLQQDPPYFSESQGQNGDDIISTVVGNPSPSSSARNSDISMFSAHNTTSPTLSYFDDYLNDDME